MRHRSKADVERCEREWLSGISNRKSILVHRPTAVRLKAVAKFATKVSSQKMVWVTRLIYTSLLVTMIYIFAERRASAIHQESQIAMKDISSGDARDDEISILVWCDDCNSHGIDLSDEVARIERREHDIAVRVGQRAGDKAARPAFVILYLTWLMPSEKAVKSPSFSRTA